MVGQLHHQSDTRLWYTQGNKIGLLGYKICNAINQAICKAHSAEAAFVSIPTICANPAFLRCFADGTANEANANNGERLKVHDPGAFISLEAAAFAPTFASTPRNRSFSAGRPILTRTDWANHIPQSHGQLPPLEHALEQVIARFARIKSDEIAADGM